MILTNTVVPIGATGVMILLLSAGAVTLFQGNSINLAPRLATEYELVQVTGMGGGEGCAAEEDCCCIEGGGEVCSPKYPSPEKCLGWGNPLCDNPGALCFKKGVEWETNDACTWVGAEEGDLCQESGPTFQCTTIFWGECDESPQPCHCDTSPIPTPVGGRISCSHGSQCAPN